MQSNRYVYPYTPFCNLQDRKPKVRFTKDIRLSLQEVKRELLKVPTPKIPHRSGSLEARILAIFLNPGIRFGPRSYILQNRAEWLSRIRYFTTREKRIELTILGFPFKTPVPLKTNRTLPDLGEILMLRRLHAITKLVKQVYPKGCRLTVFTESPFAPFAYVTPGEARRYRNFLNPLAKAFQFADTLRFIDLGSLEHFVPSFRKVFTQRCRENSASYKRRDSNFMKKFRGAFPSVFHIINVRTVPTATLAAAYGALEGKRSASKMTQEALHRLTQKTTQALIKYFAYLSIRDEYKLITRTVPHALPLTVSPKPGRLGVLPIDCTTRILPTHGVPVYDIERKHFFITYLFDLQRQKRIVSKVYVKGDREKLPFYYILQ